MTVLVTTEPLRLRSDSRSPNGGLFMLHTEPGELMTVSCGSDEDKIRFASYKRGITKVDLGVEDFGAHVIFENAIVKEIKFLVSDEKFFRGEIPRADIAAAAHVCGHFVFRFWFKIDREKLPSYCNFSAKVADHFKERVRTQEKCSICPLDTMPKNGELAIVNALPNLYDGEPFARGLLNDFCIKVGKEEFWVQKANVAAQSGKFRAMFATDMIENQTGVSTIRDEKTTPEKMRGFLDILYDRKTVNDHFTDSDWLTGVYEVAHEYQADGVKALLEDAFKITGINTTTYLQLLGVAQLYSLEFLLDRCFEAAKQLGPEFWDLPEVKENAKDGFHKALMSLFQRSLNR